MAVRMRATIRSIGNRTEELQTATNLRRALWSSSLVRVDPDHPLQGIQRDEEGRAYLEFATDNPDVVRRVIEQPDYSTIVDLSDTPPLPGEECANCGNVAGPVLPTVCPNCQFRDISPCPICGTEVPRPRYHPLSGDLFRCPHCEGRVRLRFNSPMFLPDGSYNEPLVVVEEEARAVHEVR